MRRILLALGLLLLLPSVAWAATRTTTAGGTFSLISGTPGGTVTWDVAPNAGDLLNFAHDATIIGSIDQNTTSGAGITCNAGVTLTVDGAATVGVKFAVGDGDLSCRVVASGGYRKPPQLSFGSAGLSTTEPSDVFTLNDVIPCWGDAGTAEEPDCNAGLTTPGDASQILWRWTSVVDRENGDTDDRSINDALGDIDAGDIAVIMDTTPTDAVASSLDVNAIYEIDSVAVASAPYDILIDVDQGTGDPVGMPLARRRLYQSTLSQAAAAGTRLVCVTDTAASAGALDEDHALTGRYARFFKDDAVCDGDSTAGSCEVEDRAYPIRRTQTNATDSDCGASADRIELAAPLRRSIASGAPVIVGDYGHASGNEVHFIAPVRFTHAVGATDFPEFNFLSGSTLEGVVIDNPGSVDLTGATVKHSIVKDCHQANDVVCVRLVSGTITLDGMNVTGLVANGVGAGSEGNHRISSNNSSALTLIARDLVLRHGGDDGIVIADSNTGSYDIDRLKCQWGIQGTTTGGSASCFAVGNSGTVSGTVDGVVTANYSPDDNSTPFGLGTGATSYTVRGAAIIGERAFMTLAMPVQDAYLTGQTSTFSGTSTAVPQICTRCLAEASSMTGSTSLITSVSAGQTAIITDSIIQDITTPSGFPFNQVGVAGDQILNFDNVMLRNLCSSNVTAANRRMIRTTNTLTTGTFELKRVSAIWDEACALDWEALVSTGTDATGWRLEGLLVSGYDDANGAGFLLGGTPVWTDFIATSTSTCDFLFYRNTDDAHTTPGDGVFTADTYRELAPGWVDPASGDYRPAVGSIAYRKGCGIRGGASGPGPKDSWSLSAIGVTAREIGSLRIDGGAGGGSCPAPGCPAPGGG